MDRGRAEGCFCGVFYLNGINLFLTVKRQSIENKSKGGRESAGKQEVLQHRRALV